MIRAECYQAVLGALVPLPLHKIEFDIEVCIFVLLIQSPAILYYLLNLSLACCGSLFVRRDCIVEGASIPRGLNGSSFGIEIIWKDCEELARILGRKSLPKFINALLSRNILTGLLRWKMRL